MLVVGAGTAGLHAARALAGEGFRVVVLERRTAEDGGGARWCNAVVPRHFELARLPIPEPPELRIRGGASHLVSPSGAHRVVVPCPLLECDMRLLGARLRDDAEARGARVLYDVDALELELEGARPVAARFRVGGTAHTVRARLFVDASGHRGVLRSRVPGLHADWPAVAPSDLCVAQQYVFAIRDRDGARRFLAERGVREGDALTDLGIAGGYSTRVVRVETSLEVVSVLAGSIPHGGFDSASRIVRDFRARESWVGEPLFGGGASIPLRRVYHRLTAPGVALVGDAACMVMAGHGSGIGFGLVAGRVLADAVRGAADPGDADVLFRYQSRFLRAHGAVFAAYDAVRRMSDRLGTRGVERMFAAGLFTPSLAEAALHQVLGLPSPGEAVAQLGGLARHRDLRECIAPALASMAAARAVYPAYPRRRDPRALRAWIRTADALLGAQPVA